MLIKKVSIISAHKGSQAWLNAVADMDRTSNYEFIHLYEFDDEYYRRAGGFSSRFFLRVRTFIIFPLKLIFHLRDAISSSDIVVVVTSPFYLPLIFKIFYLNSSFKKILLMNDIYPEALVLKGIVKRDSKFEFFLKRSFGRVLSFFDSVVFICESHRRYFSESKIISTAVIPVPGNVAPFKKVCIDNSVSELRFIYSGTLGFMHDTRTFLSWLDEFTWSGYIFKFFTSGASKSSFEASVRAKIKKYSINTIFLYDALPHESWIEEMLSCHIGLVFQSKGSGAVVFPSKVASNLAAGHAILAVADKESELANLILRFNCGWVVEPGDINSFNKAVLQASADKNLNIMRKNSLDLARSMFSESVISDKWTLLLRSL